MSNHEGDERVRVVVTGHDGSGRGVVVNEDHVPPAASRAAGYRYHLLWGADEVPAYPDDGLQAKWVDALPPVGGVRFAMLIVEPDSQRRPEGDADDAMTGMVVASSESQIHATATVDLLVVLDGEVWLELDDGAEIHLRRGECVVQQGTRHAWRNHASVPARVAVAVIGAHHADIPAHR